MSKLDEFKKLAKSQVLNARYVRGGDGPENNQQTTYTAGDDYAHTTTNGADNVGYSGYVPRGGTAEADPYTGG